MAYFDDRPGSFVFCRDFVSCEQDWEIYIYQKNNKRQKRIQHTDRTSDRCSLYLSYLDGMGFYECYCVYSASDRILDGQRSDFCPDHKDTQKDICKRWQFFPIHIQERHFMEKVLRNI